MWGNMSKQRSSPGVPRLTNGIRDGVEAGIAKKRRQAIVSMSKQEGQYQIARARRVVQNEQPPKPVQRVEQGVSKTRRRATWELAKDEFDYQRDRLERTIQRAAGSSGSRIYINGTEVGSDGKPVKRNPDGTRQVRSGKPSKPLVRKVRNRSEAARKAAITRKRNGK